MRERAGRSFRRETLDSTVIFHSWDDNEAELVRGLLESYGIPCQVSSQITHTLYPLTVDGLGEIRLSVPTEAVEEARQILEEHRTTGTLGGFGFEAE
ncbi:MAG: hypothetical protein DMH00_07165 [Acidobacteria bacterium]|nr:MAG: hypothetical protein DMH00_07165 [Acidobacteriota bacterium]